ncbi:MAG TPA: citrate synthase [Trebonia sp.]|nr:citrate synthase [Trebonia sp.]
MGELVTARTAAERLGVDVRTLYAYVSRGALRRVPGPDGRSSRYDADELELLARRSRPRTLPRPAASIDLVIATRVSTVTDGIVRYRGTDVLDLVKAEEPFERVADLLWQASPSAADTTWQQPALPRPPAVPIPVPAAIPILHRFAITVAAITPVDAPHARASRDPTIHDPTSRDPTIHDLRRDPTIHDSTSHATTPHVATSDAFATGVTTGAPVPDWASFGRRVIGCLTDTSGPRPGATGRADHVDPANHPADAGPVARRLWERWSPLRPTTARVRALDLALVLLAEHELALSTLSVRVAASARATPASCLLAGLSTLSGSLHGGAARTVHEKLALGEPVVTGFGHPVHRHGDPRLAPLLDAVYAVATERDRELIETARRAAPRPLNVDFALGALTYVARMPAEAATAIFAIARIAGWIAHAAEEYDEPPLRFRGRAVGPAPGRLRSPPGG